MQPANPEPLNADESSLAVAAERDRADRFAAILESTTQGVLFISAEGAVVFANPAAERILGLSVQQINGQAPRDPAWRFVRPDGSEVPHAEQPGMESLRTGLPVTNAVMGVVHVGLGAQVWISVDAVPRFLAGQAQPSAVVVTLVDITDRVRTEEVVRETNERFQLAFHASPVSVVISRPDDGVYVDVNEAALETFGYTRDEVVGRSVLSMNLWTSPMDRQEIVATLLAQGEVNRREVLLRHKDGRPLRCLVSLRLISLRGVKHLLFVSEDVTQRRVLEAQLLQSQKLEAVGRLAGGVAHDFNNLLTVIVGGAEEILDTLAPASAAHAAVQEIKEAGERASALTRQLLAVSRKHAAVPEVLDLNEVVVGMTRMLRRLIGEDLELVVLPGTGLGAVKMDRGQLEQVLLNLAVNARDAMPSGGRLSIETARAPAADAASGMASGPAVLLRVTDTGSGISPEVRPHLFEPFFTTKAPEKGTGLGLSTVSEIVSQAGGAIRVESVLGEGSSFEVRLPALNSVAQTSVPELTGTRVGGSEAVLVVEDEAPVRGLCVRILRSAGYTVLEACDGAEALALCQGPEGARVALVLTDTIMPGINGVELIARLRVSRPGLRVILMSGYTDVVAKLPSGDGPFAFLQKPFGAEVLTKAIRALLDRPSSDGPPLARAT